MLSMGLPQSTYILLESTGRISHFSLHGTAITTVEGIGSTKTKLHSVQQKLADAHGSQCGFCTPGIVMSMYTLLRNDPAPKMEDIETYFQVSTDVHVYVKTVR